LHRVKESSDVAVGEPGDCHPQRFFILRRREGRA